MKLDLREEKLLKPGEHLNIEGCPGLRLVATASRKTWTYRYRSQIDDKVRQIKIGERPAMSVAAAVAAWEQLRAARDAGRDPAKEKRAERATTSTAPSVDPMLPHGSPTVRDVLRDYVREHINANRAAKGAAEVRRMIAKMIPEKFAAKDAATVTRRDAAELIHSHAHIPVQAAKLRAELGAAWAHAMDMGRLSDDASNHWRDVLHGKLRSAGKTVRGEKIGSAQRVLSPAEMGVLINWLPNFTRLVEDVVTMYLWTGARGGEIVQMEGREVAEEDGALWWTCPLAKTKNVRRKGATDLRVPLVGRAEKIVRRRIAAHGQGFLFPGEKGGHIEQKVVGVAIWVMRPECKTRPEWVRPRLPVAHFAPHDLRRTVRTTLARLGCRSEVAEAILGHMAPGIIGVYQKYQFDAERVEWLGKLDSELERLVFCPANT